MENFHVVQFSRYFTVFRGKLGTAKIEIREIFSKFDHLSITCIQNNNLYSFVFQSPFFIG